MNAYKCDMCGEFSEDGCKAIVKIIETKSGITRTSLDCYHCCPRCLEQLENWLRGKNATSGEGTP